MTRFAIIADVHANEEALTAVLERIARLGVDRTLCCGDLVGYYASPNECIDLLREYPVESIAGNHDRAAAGTGPLEGWDVAERAIAWTKTRLTPENLMTLRGLPPTLTVAGQFILFHGALHPRQDPQCFHLVQDDDVIRTLRALQQHPARVNIGFFGHTHRGLVYRYQNGRLSRLHARETVLDEDACWLVNPGSVGQPRDGNPDASFVVFDTSTRSLEFHRVPYDREACLKKAGQYGLLPDPPIKAVAKRALRKAGKILKVR